MASWKANDNTLIHYELHGQPAGREKLLLLPGLLGAINSQWRAFVEPLSQRYSLIMVDLRGHGRSENNDLRLMPEQMVQDLIGLLDHLAVESAHVAGFDLGGYLGLMLLLHRPRLVNTLLMHGTKFFWSQQAAAEMRHQLNPEHIAQKVPNYANQLSAEHGANRWRPLVRQAADMITHLAEMPIREAAVRRVKAPVLVSVGDRDELVPVQEAFRLSHAMKNASLLVMPDVRHPFRSLDLIPLLPVMEKFHRR